MCIECTQYVMHGQHGAYLESLTYMLISDTDADCVCMCVCVCVRIPQAAGTDLVIIEGMGRCVCVCVTEHTARSSGLASLVVNHTRSHVH